MSKGIALVSGATGFLGTEVARVFVDAGGYTVRGTARSQSKVKEWEVANPEYAGKVEWFIVEDMVKPGVYDAAVKGVNYVVHTASPFAATSKDIAKDVLEPAIQGARNMLIAAKAESSVKHFVFTSSVVAIMDVMKGLRPDYTYTTNDWNPGTYEMAVASGNPVFAYTVSKVLAEKAIWDDKERKFAVTNINPSFIFGPPHQAVKAMSALNESVAAVWKLISASAADPIPETIFNPAVDVRDVAELHLRAVETSASATGDRRVVASSFTAYNSQVAAVVREHVKNDPVKLARVRNGGGDEPKPHFGLDNSSGEELLGRKFMGITQSVTDTAESLWALEAKLKN